MDSFLKYFYANRSAMREALLSKQQEPEDMLGGLLLLNDEANPDRRFQFMQPLVAETQTRYPCACSPGFFDKVMSDGHFVAFVNSRLPVGEESFSIAIEKSKEQEVIATCENKVGGTEKNPIKCGSSIRIRTKTEIVKASEVLFVKVDRGVLGGTRDHRSFPSRNQKVLENEIYINVNGQNIWYTLTGGVLHINAAGYATSGHYLTVLKLLDSADGKCVELNDEHELVPSNRLGYCSLYMYVRKDLLDRRDLDASRNSDESMQVDEPSSKLKQRLLSVPPDKEAKKLVIGNKLEKNIFFRDLKFTVFWKMDDDIDVDWMMYPLNLLFMSLIEANKSLPCPPDSRTNWTLTEYFQELFDSNPGDVINPAPIVTKLAFVCEKPELLFKDRSLPVETFFEINFIEVLEKCFPTKEFIPYVVQKEDHEQCDNCKAEKSLFFEKISKVCPVTLKMSPKNRPRRGVNMSIQFLVDQVARMSEGKIKCHNCKRKAKAKTTKTLVYNHSPCLILSIDRSEVPKKSALLPRNKLPPELEVNEQIKVNDSEGKACFYALVGGICQNDQGQLSITFKKGNTFCTISKRVEINAEGSTKELAKLSLAKIYFYRKMSSTDNSLESEIRLMNLL